MKVSIFVMLCLVFIGTLWVSGCGDDKVLSPVSEGSDPLPIIKEVRFLPAEIRNKPLELIAGDNEYNGHGPRVEVSCWIAISADALECVARIDITMTETTWDNTTGVLPERYRYVTIYRLASEGHIVSIQTPPSCSGTYLDNDWAIDTVVPAPSNGPVAYFELLGDGKGGDFDGDGSQLVRLVWNPIRVRISSAPATSARAGGNQDYGCGLPHVGSSFRVVDFGDEIVVLDDNDQVIHRAVK